MLFPQRLGLVFYFAVAGTDCKILVDMFTKLFGPPEMLNPMDLEGPVAKKACTEAKQFEEEALHCEGGPDTSKPTILYPASHTIPISFSILSIQSTVHYAEEKSSASGQNRDSTYSHTCRHLSVSLACSWPNCGKAYDVPDGLIAHVDKKHRGALAPAAISKEEAQVVVAGLSKSK